MSENKGKPASFTDIAFDSGRIYERVEIAKKIEAMPFMWLGEKRVIYLDKLEILKTIREGSNDRTN